MMVCHGCDDPSEQNVMIRIPNCSMGSFWIFDVFGYGGERMEKKKGKESEEENAGWPGNGLPSGGLPMVGRSTFGLKR